MSKDNVQESAPATDAGPLTLEDQADAILKSWEDQEEPVSENEPEATDEAETDETESAESEDEDEEILEEEEIDEDPVEEDSDEDQDDIEDEELEDETPVEISDETLVDIQVDGETKQASIKDLKRLWGQEASLTQKSQLQAQARKETQERMQKADASLQAMLSRAQERYKPYSEVDMLVASKTMSNEDFAALRSEAKLAEDDVKFLTEEADKFYGFIQQEQQKKTKESAANAVKVLQQNIPNWSNSLYNEIRSYAISAGLEEDTVNSIVDPNVIMLLNKAKLYDQTKKVATTKKAKAQKVLRTKKAPLTKAGRAKREKDKYVERLQKSGDNLESLADIIAANWESA